MIETKKKRISWWNDEVKQKNVAFRNWLKRRTPETGEEYVICRNRVETEKESNECDMGKDRRAAEAGYVWYKETYL